MKEALAFVLPLFAMVFIVTHCTGCASDQAKEAAANAAYAAEHMRCVDKYDTKQEIDACRAAVRIRWGIAETVHDAGADR